MSQTISGVVAEHLAKNFDGLFQAVERSIPVGTSSVNLFPNDPERVFAYMANIGAELATIQINRQAVGGEGFLLAANGASMSFNMVEDFIMPSYAYYAISVGVGTTITVVEVRRVNQIRSEGNDNAS